MISSQESSSFKLQELRPLRFASERCHFDLFNIPQPIEALGDLTIFSSLLCIIGISAINRGGKQTDLTNDVLSVEEEQIDEL